MTENDENKGKIRDIAERVINSEIKDNARTTSKGTVEYKFSAGLPETALIFVDDEEEQETDSQVKPNLNEEAAEMDDPGVVLFDMKTEPPEPDNPPRDVDCEEFDLPEMFVMSEEYSEIEDEFDMAPRVWRTYIPRFTEVTERTYRMKDPDAPKKKASSSSLDAASEAPIVPEVRVDVGYDGNNDDPNLKEIESPDDEAVIVNVDSTEELKSGEHINVFKFGKKEEKVSEPEPTDEELERRRISDLTGHTWQEPTSEQPVNEETPEPETTEHYDETLDASDILGDEPYNYEEQAAEEPKFHEQFKADENELPESERPRGWNTEVPGTNKHEYVNYASRDAIKDSFLDKLLSCGIRMIVSSILALAILLIELLPLVKIDLISLIGLGAYPLALCFIECAFIVAFTALSLPEIINAFRLLPSIGVTPELVLPFCGVILFIYTVSAGYGLSSEYPPLVFIYGFISLIVIAGGYYLCSGNFTAFKNLSSADTKTVLDTRLTRHLERENIALDGMVDEFKSVIARDFKCSFVSDFMKSADKRHEGGKNNIFVLSLSFGVALACALALYLMSENLVSALCAFTVILLFGFPVFSILSHKLIYYHTALEADAQGTSYIGQSAIWDNAKVDCVTFDDTEVFGFEDVSFKEVSLSDRQGDLRKAMRQMASLFTAVGGPLEELFSASLGKRYASAENVVVEPEGLIGTVDGVKIMAGTADFMRLHGVKTGDRRESKLESTRVMYGAEDGVLFAKFSIQYSFSEDFARCLFDMKKYGITPLIYTRDPNVNNELLKFLTGGKDVIRILKKTALPEKKERIYRRLSAGVFTYGKKSAAVDSVIIAKKYCHLQSNLALTELTASAVGALTATALSIFGMLSASLLPVIIAVWQIGWCIALGMISRSGREISSNKKKNKK